MNSERAKSIVTNAESQLVNERIRLINSQLTALRDEYSRFTDWVKCILPAELADTVFTHVLTVQENEFVKTKARHLQKFERFWIQRKDKKSHCLVRYQNYNETSGWLMCLTRNLAHNIRMFWQGA